MAYSAPSTRSTGYLVTATNWNELVNNDIAITSWKIGGVALNTYANSSEVWRGVACRAYENTTTSHATSGSWQTLTFDQENFDSDTIHSVSSNTENFTVPITGYYLCTCGVLFAGNATGDRAVRVQRGGTTFGETYMPAANANAKSVQGAWVLYAQATQNITFGAFQSSGGALNMNAASDYGMHATITYLGSAS